MTPLTIPTRGRPTGLTHLVSNGTTLPLLLRLENPAAATQREARQTSASGGDFSRRSLISVLSLFSVRYIVLIPPSLFLAFLWSAGSIHGARSACFCFHGYPFARQSIFDMIWREDHLRRAHHMQQQSHSLTQR